jgi:hypothetical protein
MQEFGNSGKDKASFLRAGFCGDFSPLTTIISLLYRRISIRTAGINCHTFDGQRGETHRPLLKGEDNILLDTSLRTVAKGDFSVDAAINKRQVSRWDRDIPRSFLSINAQGLRVADPNSVES